MVSLRRLDIDELYEWGRFRGIVERIGTLTSLTRLSLSDVMLKGSTLASLEAAFSRLGSLEELTIEEGFDEGYDEDEDEDEADLPGSCLRLAAIAKCSSLRKLGTTRFHPRRRRASPRRLHRSCATCVASIDVHSLDMVLTVVAPLLFCARTDLPLPFGSGAGWIERGKVLEAIGRGCSKLRELSLQDHSAVRMDSLGTVLGDNYRGLTSLDLHLFGRPLDKVPETEVFALVSRLAGTLRELTISGDYGGEQGAKDIARFLGGGLERLTLPRFSGIGHAGLLAVATQCSNLRALSIAACAVNETTLPMIMPHLTGLLALDMSRMVGQGGFTIEHMRAISMCTRLEKLDLDDNDLGDEIVIHIVSSCDRLRDLRLLENRLTDAVAPALMRLRHLEALEVRRTFGQNLLRPSRANKISEAALEELWRLPRLLAID